MSFDYYEKLEISSDASKEEIKEAYRTLAQMYHPDKYNQSSAKVKKMADKKFKEINEAYETLSDENKRVEYDRKMRNEQERQRHEREEYKDDFDGYDEEDEDEDEDDYEGDSDSADDFNEAILMMKMLLLADEAGRLPEDSGVDIDSVRELLHLMEEIKELVANSIPGVDSSEEITFAYELLHLMQSGGDFDRDDAVNMLHSIKKEMNGFCNNQPRYKNTGGISAEVAAKLKKLEVMRNAGILSEEKYARKKAELLGRK